MRAGAEDRIRTLKDTGLTNLPLHAFGKSEVWLMRRNRAAPDIVGLKMIVIQRIPPNLYI